MPTSYFTFGQAHTHSVNGFTYDKDVIVEIEADDPRQIMFSWFGQKWSHEYTEAEVREMLHWFPRGIHKL